MNDIKHDIIQLDLHYLPRYAVFLLEHRLNAFVKTLIANSYEAQLPLLRMLERLTQEEIFDMSLASNRNMLNSLKDNTIEQYIETSKDNWINNQLKIISKEHVIAKDIVLVNYVRKKTFRTFIPEYTADIGKALSLSDEIDRFISKLDAVLFETYIGIQQERIHETNLNLRKREDQLLEAQSIAQIGSFEWNFKGGNSSYTPEVFKIFEFDKTSSLPEFLEDVHPDDRLRLRASIEKAMHDGAYECEYRYQRNNKSKVLFSRGKVYFDKNIPVKMIGTVMDVTEKSLFLSRLQENEELSKQSQALTHTGTWKWIVEKNEILWSDEMYRIYGLEPQSERITFDRFVNFIHPAYREKRIAEITEGMRNGEASDYIMKIITQDGNEKVLKGRGQVLLNKNKQPLGILGTCQDITTEFHLSQELKTRNDELSRKNRVLESFNFIATHDLQEPLRKIQVYSGRMLREGLTEIPQKFLNYFDKISRSSGRMQKMIEDFLIFYQSLNTDHTFEMVNLIKTIEEIKVDFSNSIEEKNASIKVSDLPSIRGIPVQIKEMLKQLIGNAIKFSKPGISPEISISHTIEKSERDKAVLRLIIKDNGIGFDNKYAERIFDLFQKLHSKDEYPGSGIGLSLCKKIVEDHEGVIDAKSEIGVGSEICVWLPLE